jgi:hypothetical protein
MRTPNFFIVGAPKSGTTALYQYLRAHPDIFMPDAKEPHYFAPDLHSTKFIRDRGEYLALFSEAGETRMVGEASVYYLYSRQAASEIHRFEPMARIIVMLRNPADMLYSLHSQAVYSGYEDLSDFGEALAAEIDRKAGQRIPGFCHFPQGLLYREIGRYAAQVKRFLDAFGRDQLHFIFFQDFSDASAESYRRCLGFLGVESSFDVEFERVNPNKQIRSTRLQHLAAKHTRLRATFKRFFPKFYGRLYRLFYRVNTSVKQRPRMDPELRERLLTEFAEDADELSRLLGRDLSEWMPADRAAVGGSGGADGRPMGAPES